MISDSQLLHSNEDDQRAPLVHFATEGSPQEPNSNVSSSTKFIIEPDDLLQSSLPDRSERLLRSMQRLVPKIKLEIVSVGVIRVMIGLMWVLGVFNLLLNIVIVAAIANADTPGIGEVSPLWSAVYFIEGLTRSTGVVTLLFLALTFPQRMLCHRKKTNEPLFWNQILIIVMTMLMSIVPGYSVYEIVVFWMDYYDRSNPFSLDGQLTEASFSFGVLALLYPYSDVAIAFNTVTSMIVLAFSFFFFGGVYHSFYQTARRSEDTLHPDQKLHREADNEETYTRNRLERARDESIRADDEAEFDDNSQAAKAYHQQQMALEAKDWVMDSFYRTKLKAIEMWKSYMEMTGWIPVGFQIAVFIYLILLLVLPLTMQFNPSVVPLVSLITIIRVCTTSATEFEAGETNITIPVNVGEPDEFNITLQWIIKSSVEVEDELGVCSPSQADRKPFQRAFAVVVFSIVELWLFASVYTIERRARKFLRGTSYAQTRREILGFHFFKHISVICWTFIILAGVFSSAVNPLDMYFLEDGDARFSFTTKVLTVVTVIDPLYQVGVGMGTIGFGAFLTMITTWIALLAYAYLPFDSYGIKGWFKGNTSPEDETGEGHSASFSATSAIMHNHHQYLVLLPTEGDVEKLIELRRREQERMKQLPRILQKFKSNRGVLSALSSRWDLAGPLVAQVKANLLVMETEILLFHFMHLSYLMANKRYDMEQQQRLALTWEEKCALVEDSRFRLVEHIIDVDTDTHVMVFDSADRVVVAFRGSVSLTNWQTDFDSSEVICSYVQDISPDLSDIPQAVIQNAKRVASNPPKVHGGFVKAYETIREKLKDVCKRLLFNPNNISPQQQEEDPTTTNNDPLGSKAKNQVSSNNHNNESKVLFVTGHSLGGGLAILCSADLAVQLKLPPSRIAVTTWGSPKVGTFSFMCRFNRVVRSARRFCMADDLITRLPIDPVLKNLTLKGWWHCGTEILLNDTGNMLIRPTPLERFMFSRTIGSPQAHLRMTYATALMLWVVRSHPDYEPDWWVGVVTLFYKNATKRLKPVPRNLKEKLLESLLKAGVTYTHGNRVVRDMMVDTAMATAESVSALERKGAVPVSVAMRNELEEQEPDVSVLVTELLVNLRLRREKEFDEILDTLIDRRAKGTLFPANLPEKSKSLVDERHKRGQDDAGLNDDAIEATTAERPGLMIEPEVEVGEEDEFDDAVQSVG